MYNLHTHTLLSDGVLLPSEVAVRYLAAGYNTIAITDHADYSNIGSIVKSTVSFTRNWPSDCGIKVLPGIELTHLPPKQFKPLAKYARSKGIKIIVAHGETVCEPVIKGTNLAALEADIDILAHPGLISEGEIKLAKRKGIFLELTSRSGHSQTNKLVAGRALKLGARLILNNDSHAPEDIISPRQLVKVGINAGLSPKDIDRIYKELVTFIKKKEAR